MNHERMEGVCFVVLSVFIRSRVCVVALVMNCCLALVEHAINQKTQQQQSCRRRRNIYRSVSAKTAEHPGKSKIDNYITSPVRHSDRESSDARPSPIYTCLSVSPH
jgi:hypothetical protein